MTGVVKYYEAFGKTLSLKQWEQEDACVVSARLLGKRINELGWPVEKSLTTAAAEPRQFTYAGIKKTLTEWAKDPICAVSDKRLKARVSEGWDFERALTSPYRGPVLYEAFGERLSLDDWAAHEACVVGVNTLKNRVENLGWEINNALTLPAGEYGRLYEAFGQSKTLPEWSKSPECNCTYKTLTWRVRKGWDLETAISGKGRTYVWEGEELSLEELSDITGVDVGLLYSRHQRGWNVHDAVYAEYAVPRKSPKVMFRGEQVSVNDLVDASDEIDNYGTMHSRLFKLGMKPEDAVSTPLPAPPQGQVQLADFVESLGFDFVVGDRTILEGKEIDIFIPELQVGLEFNGVYWHSEKFRDKNYHKDKQDLAEHVGVRLYSIWEDDWVFRRSAVESMVQHKLGCSSDGKVGASKCKIVDVSRDDADVLLEARHVQGPGPASIRIGLKYRDTLVAVMTFRKHSDGFELTRYATACSVPGGFSRLVAEFRRRHPDKLLVSFADRMVSDGALYEKNGWRFDGHIRPDYRYLVGGQLVHKFNYRKARFEKDPDLLYQEGLTESQLAELNGMLRVWDAGKRRYVFDM